MSQIPTNPNTAPGAAFHPPRRRRWVSIVLSMVLLSCGGVIGSGLTLLVVVRGVQRGLRHPEEFPARATAHLRRILDLSNEQAAQVEDILRTRQVAIQRVRREVQPQLMTEIELIHTQVAHVLTPKQAERWNTWFADKKAKWLPPLPKEHEQQREQPHH
jgi:hypothetical protein